MSQLKTGQSIHLSTPLNTPTFKTAAGSSLFPTDTEFISTLPYCRRSLSLITSLSGKPGYSWTYMHTHTHIHSNAKGSFHCCPLSLARFHHWQLSLELTCILPPLWTPIRSYINFWFYFLLSFCPSLSHKHTLLLSLTHTFISGNLIPGIDGMSFLPVQRNLQRKHQCQLFMMLSYSDIHKNPYGSVYGLVYAQGSQQHTLLIHTPIYSILCAMHRMNLLQ